MSESSLGATRVLLALEDLAQHPKLGVTGLSAHFGWSKSVSHRLLQSLVEAGYAEQLPDTDEYTLTSKPFTIGSTVINRNGLTEVALPVMERFLKETGETINLAVLEGCDVVFILKVEGEALLGANIRVGCRFPAHTTALGKALMAHLPQDELEKLLADLKLVQYTPNTVSTEEELLKELEKTRERGYAIDKEELSLAMRCVGAAIRDASGYPIAALSIAGPIGRFHHERLHELGELLSEAATDISKSLS